MGSVDFLISEVETNRRELDVLRAENNVMNNFFNMIDRLGAPKSRGYGEDKLRQAKNDFKQAVDDAKGLNSVGTSKSE